MYACIKHRLVGSVQHCKGSAKGGSSWLMVQVHTTQQLQRVCEYPMHTNMHTHMHTHLHTYTHTVPGSAGSLGVEG